MSNKTAQKILELRFLRYGILHPWIMMFAFGVFIFIAQILAMSSARYPIGIMGYDGLIFWRLEHFGTASPQPNDWVANLPFWGAWIFIGLATLFSARYQHTSSCRRWIRAIIISIPLGMLLMALILLVLSFLIPTSGP